MASMAPEQFITERISRASGPMLREHLNSSSRIADDMAIQSAERLLDALLKRDITKPHVGVSPEGSVTLSLCRNHRLASFECDTDGDVILVLSDKESDSDPVPEFVTTSNMLELLVRAQQFVR